VKTDLPGHSVLLIEDNPGDARLIGEMLAEEETQPFRLSHAARLDAGIEQLSHKGVDLVLLDLSLPDSHGLETFAKVYAHSPKVPIIVLSGNDDQQLALYAVKSGAQDYLVKGKIDSALLLKAMQYSIERKRYQEELERQANYDARSRWCSSTSTTSRSSTIPSGTTSATRCCATWASASPPRCATATRWRAWAATSSCSSCPTRRART
jgi:DNA-binding NarL/FixJ family response regulator